MPQTAVGTNLLEALEVLAQLHVERVGDHLAELAIFHVLLPVQHPIRHLELARVLDDRHQTLNLLLRQLTGPLAQLHLSLLAADVREAASDTLDGSEGEHRLHLAVKVGVQHTQDVLEVGLVHDERHDASSRQSLKKWKSEETGMTLGTPLAMMVKNKDQRSGDYLQNDMSVAYRPSHADATYDAKYGVRAIAGGGRSSARETIGRVAAGAVAREILRLYNDVEIIAFVSRVKDVEWDYDPEEDGGKNLLDTVTREKVEEHMTRCPDPNTAEDILAAIDEVRKKGNSIGGVVTCICRNVPAGLGSPVFDKLEADLAKACMSLPAAKGFESGSGFKGTLMTGLEHNDEFYIDSDTGATRTRTNRSGGIQGGISNGEDIVFKVAFKPTSTIGQEQGTVTRDGRVVKLRGKGRHDPCVLPRAVPMVEAMVAITLVDALMMQKAVCELFPNTDSLMDRPNPMGTTAHREGGPNQTVLQSGDKPDRQRIDEE